MANQVPPPLAAPGGANATTELEWLDYPLTPWAERFGRSISHQFHRQNPSRSGFAAEFPPLHPKYHGDTPETFTRPTRLAQLDDLYYGEAMQLLRFRGVMSRQVPALAAELSLLDDEGDYPMPGGNTEEDNLPAMKEILDARFKREMIEPDESSWFKFLRKDRWFGPMLDGGAFSPDNEEIWAVVRMCLELANRILRELITQENPWMVTLLWGYIVRWSEWDEGGAPDYEARLILSFQKEQGLLLRWGGPGWADTPKCPGGYFSLVEDLLENLAWSFVETKLQHVWGYFTMSGNQPVICLTTSLFQSFLDKDLTYAEKSNMIWMMAGTICHELMHAILSLRMNAQIRVSEEACLNYEEREICFWPEPFIDCEPFSEAGESFENAIFGGRINAPPSTTELVLKNSRGTIPMAYICVPWISAIVARHYLGDSKSAVRSLEENNIDSVTQITIIPAAATYRMLSKKFWDTPGPKDFTIPDVFLSLHDDIRNSSPVMTNLMSPYLPLYERLARRYNAREQLLYMRRNSFIHTREVWQQSIWGFTAERFIMEAFRASFNLRDEVTCQRGAQGLLTWLPAGQAAYMPFPGEPNPSVGWVWFVVGVLMMASLPIRKEPVSTPAVLLRKTNFPSAEAAAAGRTPFRSVYHLSEHYTEQEVKPPMIVNPITTQYVVLDDWARLNFLGVVQSVVENVATAGNRMPKAWLEEIHSTYDELLKQFTEPGRLRSWAPKWPFVIPEYDGMEWVVLNEEVPWGAPFDERYRPV